MSLNVGSHTVDLNSIFLRDHPNPFSDRAIVPAGEIITRGMVLGQITADLKVIESLSAAVDGSEDYYAIAGEDLDTSATGTNADTEIMLWLTGGFNEAKILFGTGHTQASLLTAMRALNTFVRPLGGAS